MPDQNKANLKRSFFRALLRHRWKFALAILLMMCGTVVLLANWPRTYESRAKLLVRIGSESVTLDPTATIGQTIAYEKLQEEEVNSVLEIFNSRTIYERVVDRLGPDEILDPKFGLLEYEETATDDKETAKAHKSIKKRSSFVSDAKAWSMGVVDRVLIETGIKDPISRRERAIRELEDALYASAGRKSNVVSVVCTSSSPYGARRVVAIAIEEFQKHHIKLSRTEGSHEFFVQQESNLAEQLNAAYQKLRDRKTEYGMVDAAASRQVLLTEISDVELAILQADREIQYIESQLSKPLDKSDLAPAATKPVLVAKPAVDTEPAKATAAVSKTVEAGVAAISTPGARTAGGQGARDGMRQQLYQLEIEEQELLSTHTPTHPSVVALREKRLEAERIYRMSESADLAALKQRRTLLTSQLDRLESKVATLNKHAIEIEDLTREASLIEQKHREHAGRLEQARIGKEMDTQQISSINEAQPASFIEKPISPNKPLTLAGGFMLAVMAGLALVVSLEWFDTRLRTRDEVESNLNLPVLAVVNNAAGRGEEPLIRQEFGAVLSHLRKAGTDNSGPKTIAVIGCGGKQPDQIAADLSVSAAGLLSGNVVAVDADKVSRAMSDHFGANGQPGFSDLVSGGASYNDCVTRTRLENLTLISAGSGESEETQQPPRQVRDHLQELSTRFDLVIADLPAPSNNSADSVSARDFDACLLVVQGGETSIARAAETQQSLKESGANVIGVILQGERETLPHWVRRLV